MTEYDETYYYYRVDHDDPNQTRQAIQIGDVRALMRRDYPNLGTKFLNDAQSVTTANNDGCIEFDDCDVFVGLRTAREYRIYRHAIDAQIADLTLRLADMDLRQSQTPNALEWQICAQIVNKQLQTVLAPMAQKESEDDQN